MVVKTNTYIMTPRDLFWYSQCKQTLQTVLYTDSTIALVFTVFLTWEKDEDIHERDLVTDHIDCIRETSAPQQYVFIFSVFIYVYIHKVSYVQRKRSHELRRACQQIKVRLIWSEKLSGASRRCPPQPFRVFVEVWPGPRSGGECVVTAAHCPRLYSHSKAHLTPTAQTMTTWKSKSHFPLMCLWSCPIPFAEPQRGSTSLPWRRRRWRKCLQIMFLQPLNNPF